MLAFIRQQRTELPTARPELNIPRLAPGDRWYLCAARWPDALHARIAPPARLAATHENALRVCGLEAWTAHVPDNPSSK